MARPSDELTQWASKTAESFLRGLEPRWTHVQAVAKLADSIGTAFGEDHGVLVAAAYLHDIGYSQQLSLTGFHPLDGARFVREQGEERVARLVAHHSGARHEARIRGLNDFEDEFPYDATSLDQALTYCDLTTSPKGERIRLEERVAEIQSRYGADHEVARAIGLGVAEFEEAVRATERRLVDLGCEVSGSLAYRE